VGIVVEPITLTQKSYIRALLVGMIRYPTVVRSYVSEVIGRDIDSINTEVDLDKLSKDEASNIISGILGVKKEMTTLKNYTVKIESPFLLTPTQIKNKLGIGFKVLAVEIEKEINRVKITSVDSAVDEIIKQGYRALIRAHHPDVGGDTEVAVILNRAKKELDELMRSIR